MKKVFLIFLVVLMALALVACKQEQEDSGGSDSTAMMTASEGQAALLEQGQSEARGIDYTGFRIIAEFDINGTKTYIDVGGLDDVYWVACQSSEIDSDTEYTYCKYLDGTDYLYSPSLDKLISLGSVDLKTQLFGSVTSLLYMAQIYEGYLTKGSDEDGCYTYSGTFAMPGYDSMTIKFLVDKTYGFTKSMTYSDPETELTFKVTPTLSNPSTPTGYGDAKDCTTVYNYE
ncbi:MAG TPA: hypothetical protein DCP98_09400 [Sphaerochaeta sp.]|nr:hypothetical protein [Sphaerochaeta sp.]